jgi:purine nucleosidase
MKKPFFPLILALLAAATAWGQEKRYVIIDQDAAGPAGTDQQAMLVLLQAPDVEILGITVVSGDAWRDEEVAHTLRMLELIGRTDVPVVPGAVFPLVRTQQFTELWEQLHGKVAYKGAWRPGGHGPWEVPALLEGNPTTKPLDEDAAHFLVHMVRKYPKQVTIYAAGPLTDLALAIRIDPHFPELTKGLVFMGASLNPRSDDPELAGNPRREFNLWWDPEASHIVLTGRWPSIVCTTVDVSIQTQLTGEMLAEISKVQLPVAQYLAKYARAGRSYLWDELAAAAWLDPSLIKKETERLVYMDVDLDRGAGYGDVLTWFDRINPSSDLQLVRAQMDVDVKRFEQFFVKQMTRPTPNAKNPLMLKQAGTPAGK